MHESRAGTGIAEASHPRVRAFSALAWTHLAWLLGVILFGAWVRITHSGAGCGEHWPLCDGEVIPFAPSTEKLIEFTHRATSGLLGLLSLALLVLSRWAPVDPRARRAAAATFALVVVESLLGAGLVLFHLVEDDASTARAVVVALHLANTLLLVAAATMAAFWARPGRPTGGRLGGPVAWTLAGLLVGVGMAGAVTALGDTLFPPAEVGGAPAVGDPHHFLVRLRVVHPVLAGLVGSALVVWAGMARARLGDAASRARTWGVQGIVLAQFTAGALTIALRAPGWMQLVHLFLADLLWVALVILLAGLPGRGEAGR